MYRGAAARRGRDSLARRIREDPAPRCPANEDGGDLASAPPGPRSEGTEDYAWRSLRRAGLARTFTSRKRTVEAVRGVDLTVCRRGDRRLPRPERRRQDHHPAHADHAAAADGGHRDRGRAATCSRDPVGVRRRIGYVPQAIGATGGGSRPERHGRRGAARSRPGCTGCRRREAPSADRAARPQLDLAGLERPAGQDAVRAASAGAWTSRSAWSTRPRLVFLDEPTTGLDPQSRSNLWDHIRGLREDLGTTVFLTTHYLDEADALCDRILIIDHGRIVAEGTPDELKRRISGDVVTLQRRAAAARRRPRRARRACRASATSRSSGAVAAADRRPRRGGPARPAARRWTRPGITLAVDPARPADARRRVPHRDRPLAARGRAGTGAPGTAARAGAETRPDR